MPSESQSLRSAVATNRLSNASSIYMVPVMGVLVPCLTQPRHSGYGKVWHNLFRLLWRLVNKPIASQQIPFRKDDEVSRSLLL